MSAEDIGGPRRWKVKKRDGSRLEPANLEVLRHWIKTGQVGPDDLVINEDLADWVLVLEAVEFDDILQKKSHTPAEKPKPISASAPRPKPPPKEEQEEEVKVPDCVFHAGTEALEICVGCGKFICEECRHRVDRKAYCKRCMAEKKAGVEPGAPLGSGAAAMVAPGSARPPAFSRLAIGSVSFAALALAAGLLMAVYEPRIWFAPAAGFFSFMAALIGGLAISRIRQSADPARGEGLAMTGLISGGVILLVTLAVAADLTMDARESAPRVAGGSDAPITRSLFRRPRASTASPDMAKKRETAAEQLLNRAADLLNDDKLERAIEKCEQILHLYPETETAKLVEERLPVLREELERVRADEEEARGRNEETAREAYEQAMEIYSAGDPSAALELLRSMAKEYPRTAAAEDAGALIEEEDRKAEKENLRKLESEARELVAKADRLLDSEQYAEAARIYGEIGQKYAKTSAWAAARLKLNEAETLMNDPSEREFHGIRKELATLTYEESIDRLQGFLGRYPSSGRAPEAREALDESSLNKRTADTLYNFGRAHFEDGKYEVALGRYRKLLQDYPRSRWASHARMEYEETLGKLEED